MPNPRRTFSKFALPVAVALLLEPSVSLSNPKTRGPSPGSKGNARVDDVLTIKIWRRNVSGEILINGILFAEMKPSASAETTTSPIATFIMAGKNTVEIRQGKAHAPASFDFELEIVRTAPGQWDGEGPVVMKYRAKNSMPLALVRAFRAPHVFESPWAQLEELSEADRTSATQIVRELVEAFDAKDRRRVIDHFDCMYEMGLAAHPTRGSLSELKELSIRRDEMAPSAFVGGISSPQLSPYFHGRLLRAKNPDGSEIFRWFRKGDPAQGTVDQNWEEALLFGKLEGRVQVCHIVTL